MFDYTYRVPSDTKRRGPRPPKDQNNMAEKNMQDIVKRILEAIEPKLSKGLENMSRGINNEIIGDAGMSYNAATTEDGKQIVGGK